MSTTRCPTAARRGRGRHLAVSSATIASGTQSRTAHCPRPSRGDGAATVQGRPHGHDASPLGGDPGLGRRADRRHRPDPDAERLDAAGHSDVARPRRQQRPGRSLPHGHPGQPADLLAGDHRLRHRAVGPVGPPTARALRGVPGAGAVLRAARRVPPGVRSPVGHAGDDGAARASGAIPPGRRRRRRSAATTRSAAASASCPGSTPSGWSCFARRSPTTPASPTRSSASAAPGSATCALSKAYQNLGSTLVGDGEAQLSVDPVGFDLVLDCTSEFYTLLSKLLLTEGVTGDVVTHSSPPRRARNRRRSPSPCASTVRRSTS